MGYVSALAGGAAYVGDPWTWETKREKKRRGVADEKAEAADAGSANYTRRKDNLLKPRKLPLGVKVTGVMTSHHQAPQEKGSVAIHFFSGGYAEKTFVWLGVETEVDGEREAIPSVTVAMEPLMGTVVKHPDALDVSQFLKDLD